MSDTLKEPKFYNIEKDVIYASESVISKTIMKKKKCGSNVTLFSFDKGQGLSEHTAPFDALVHILDGKCEFTLMGKKHILEKGNIIIMPANEPHALMGVEKFKMMLVMIKAD